MAAVKLKKQQLQKILQQKKESEWSANRSMVLKIKDIHNKHSVRGQYCTKVKKVKRFNRKKLEKLEKLKKVDVYRLKVLSDIEMELIKKLKNSQVRQERELIKLKTTLENKPTIYETYKIKAKKMQTMCWPAVTPFTVKSPLSALKKGSSLHL